MELKASERRAQLAEMLDSTVQSFENVLVESKDLAKLTRHSGMRLEKREIEEIQCRMAGTATRRVHELTAKMIAENQVCERFDELDEWKTRCETANRQLGRPNGYRFIKPKRDIGLHLSESTKSMISACDSEIERLAEQLEQESRELARRQAVAAELAAVVESQQKELWHDDDETDENDENDGKSVKNQ